MSLTDVPSTVSGPGSWRFGTNVALEVATLTVQPVSARAADRTSSSV